MKKSKLIVGIFVILLIIVGGTWFYFNQDNTIDYPIDEEKISEEVKQEEVSVEEIDTSDWLTFVDKEYGFEIKYPREWEFLDQHIKDNKIFTIVNKFKGEFSKYRDDDSVYLSISVYQNKDKSINDWIDTHFIKKPGADGGLTGKQEISIGNIKAIRGTFDAQVADFETIIFSKEDLVYKMVMIEKFDKRLESNKKYTLVLNKVINSFKFIVSD